jgi:hypothetical protein
MEVVSKNIKFKVKTSKGIRPSFNTISCLRQGNALRCMLLNTDLEEALRETEVGDGKAMFRKSGQNFWLA